VWHEYVDEASDEHDYHHRWAVGAPKFPRRNLMGGQQRGTEDWQRPDEQRYRSRQGLQPNVPSSSGGMPEGSHSDKSKKESKLRAFRDWTQTTTGVISVVISIIVALSGTGAAVVINSRSSPGPSTSSPSPSGPPSSIAPTPAPTASVSQTLLNQALLTPQTLGSATVVINTNTDLSQVIEICGGAPPDGAQLTSGQAFQNSLNGVLFSEGITYYQSAKEAAQVMTDDISAVGQTGCSYSNNGNTEQYGGAASISLPQGCTGGPSLETTTSIGIYSGYHVQVACGNFAIGLNYMTSVPEIGSQGTTNGYLNNLVGRLMKALRSGR